MLRLIVHRLLFAALTIMFVSMIIFAGTEILPGDVATAILGQAATPENTAAMRKELGLDRPPVARYIHWLTDFVQGDLGTSLSGRRPIAPQVGFRLGNTLILAAVASAIAIPVAITLGLLAAIFQGTVFDRVVSLCTIAAISLPEFLVGYILILYFSVKFDWLPSLSIVTRDMNLWDRLPLLALPAITLTIGTVAAMMRMTRASIISVMSSAYIEMAILKGISGWRIVIQHALPNAMSPIIYVVALNMAYLVVGVVVVEVVFTYPGIGQYMVDAVARRDVPVVQACGLLFAMVFVGFNMVADILAVFVNPRLRHPK